MTIAATSGGGPGGGPGGGIMFGGPTVGLVGSMEQAMAGVLGLVEV